MKRTKNPAKEAEYRKRAADLVAQMTLHEKVSQMLSWAPAIERLGKDVIKQRYGNLFDMYEEITT